MLSQSGVQVQPLEINDFSGGMTDSFIAAQNNEFEKADNFTINDYGKLITRDGLEFNDVLHPRIDSAKRINKIIDLELELFLISNRNLYHVNDGFNIIKGPSNNDCFSSGTETSTQSVALWNKQAFFGDSEYSKIIKLYKDGTNWKVSNLGLPVPDVSSTIIVANNPGAENYIYAFVFRTTYSNQGVEFQEVSGVSKFKEGIGSSVNTSLTVCNIPSLVNSGSDNYDTANVKVDIYRTQANGTVFFFVDSVDQGITFYLDELDDETLSLRDFLYITGDRPDHEEPPPAKYLEVLNDVLYLGNVKEGGVTYPNRLRISNRFQPWSCPGSFYEDFQDDIMGLSSFGPNLIVFCKKSTTILSGFYLPDGSGGVQKRKISDTIGCVSASSIVKTNSGVWWAGNDGFYYTDGSVVQRITEKLNYTYKTLTASENQKKGISGTYDPVGNRILWTMQKSDVGVDNDIIFVNHLNFGIRQNMAFTTWSGGEQNPTNFSPTCVHYFNNTLYHADTRGFFFKYSQDKVSDPKIDLVVETPNWLEATIMYDYRGPAFNFGSSAGRKWVPWIILEADNTTSVSVLISSNNDNTGQFTELKNINYKGNIEWGDYDIVWQAETVRWNYFPLIKAKRRFPSGDLRCAYKQIRFSNAFAEITSSNVLGKATFDPVNKLIKLDDSSKIWPRDILDYFITVAGKNYRILTRSNTTLYVEDVGLDLPGGSLEWSVNGYKRREILKIISYVLDYSFTSQTQDAYKGSTSA